MGWTFTRRQKGQSTVEFFRRELDHEHGHVLDAAARGFTEAYVAYELLDRQTDERRGVIGVVCLMQWRHDERFNFGYKDIEECAGPVYCNCPRRILEQLTDFDFGSERANRYARRWRQRCRERLRQREARPSLHAADLIWFPQPLHFASGAECQVLQVHNPRRLEFTSPGSKRSEYKLQRDSLDGALVIASSDPQRNTQTLHPAFDDLMGRYGSDRVGRAYRHALEEAPLRVWGCTRDPLVAGERVAEMIEAVITAPSPAAWTAEQRRLLE